MKKVLLLTVAIVLGVSMSAQKGMWVGGALGYNSSEDAAKLTTSGFSILPEFGMKLQGNWDMGIVLGYDQTKLEVTTSSTIKTNTFEVRPFVRYNFLQGKLGGLFVDTYVNYKNEKIDGFTDATNIFGFGFTPGVKVKVSENFCVIVKIADLIGYNHSTNGDAKASGYNFGVDMNNLQFGLVYTF